MLAIVTLALIPRGALYIHHGKGQDSRYDATSGSTVSGSVSGSHVPPTQDA